MQTPLRRPVRLVLTLAIIVVSLLALIAPGALASGATKRFRLEITNSTGQTISPMAVIAAPKGWQPFVIGGSASPELRSLAEMGNPQPLVELAKTQGAFTAITIDAPVGPDETSYVEFDAPKLARVVWCSMLGITNDGFTCGIDRLPTKFETISATSNSYDAGTEVNTESAADLVALGGMGHVAEHDVVMPHPGIQGGADLDPTVVDWMDSVGRFSIVRSAAMTSH